MAAGTAQPRVARSCLAGAVLASLLATLGGVAHAAEPAKPVKLRSITQGLKLADESPVNFADAFKARKAKALVLNFFATDCAPCIAELPEVQELAQRKGLELWIIAITRSTDDSANTCPGKPELESFFKERPELASRVLFDECGKLLRAFGGSDAAALPVTYLFGPDLKATQIQQGRAPQGRTLGQVFEVELAKLVRR
jgi:hypothetical protein